MAGNSGNILFILFHFLIIFFYSTYICQPLGSAKPANSGAELDQPLLSAALCVNYQRVNGLVSCCSASIYQPVGCTGPADGDTELSGPLLSAALYVNCQKVNGLNSFCSASLY